MEKRFKMNTKKSYDYERSNPGAAPGTPHRPDSSYGINKGRAGGTYGDAKIPSTNDDDDLIPVRKSPERKNYRSNVTSAQPDN